MCEGIGEALQIVCEVLHTVLSSAKSTCAKECAAHHGLAREPFSAN
jgi:hypothetical protein